MAGISSEHAQALVGTGIAMGLLHVLSPDHLAALSTLSVGGSCKAFTLGVRWGVGHSSGLLICAFIFISLKGNLDLRVFGRYCDALVGGFMMVIGTYGVIGSLKTHREKKVLSQAKRDNDISANSSSGGGGSMSGSSSSSSLLESAVQSSERDDIDGAQSHLHHQHHHHHHHDVMDDCGRACPFLDMRDPLTQRLVSFLIGLLHGVAGPGGILGVLPAVEMQQWQSSCLYLGSFIFASTLMMGSFAAVYGESTRRLGSYAESLEHGIRVFSSSLSILVGAVWLILSILGKLDDFFH